jgi:hypothetical protein
MDRSSVSRPNRVVKQNRCALDWTFDRRSRHSRTNSARAGATSVSRLHCARSARAKRVQARRSVLPTVDEQHSGTQWSEACETQRVSLLCERSSQITQEAGEVRGPRDAVVVLLHSCRGAVAVLCGCGLPEASGVASFSASASVSSLSKSPARSPPTDGPARSLRRRRGAPTARRTAGLPAVAVRAGTAEVLRIEDSLQPENLRFSRLSFATLTKTPPAPIGVAQTTTLHAGRQPASPEVTLAARGSTARSPRSSTAHCSRDRDRAAPLSHPRWSVPPSGSRRMRHRARPVVGSPVARTWWQKIRRQQSVLKAHYGASKTH